MPIAKQSFWPESVFVNWQDVFDKEGFALPLLSIEKCRSLADWRQRS